jgi:hypothetical protein
MGSEIASEELRRTLPRVEAIEVKTKVKQEVPRARFRSEAAGFHSGRPMGLGRRIPEHLGQFPGCWRVTGVL